MILATNAEGMETLGATTVPVLIDLISSYVQGEILTKGEVQVEKKVVHQKEVFHLF